MSKKQWSAPNLTVHGVVEAITQQNKDFGSSDGFTFQGQGIKNVP